jgi:hypothetical protein
LELLSFSFSWLWPAQIHQPVIVLVIALTVLQHLRIADPRHMPAFRIAVGVVAAFVILVPIAQNLITDGRWTNVQATQYLRHPSLRFAAPKPAEDFVATELALKARADAVRQRKEREGDDEGDFPSMYDYDH